MSIKALYNDFLALNNVLHEFKLTNVNKHNEV